MSKFLARRNGGRKKTTEIIHLHRTQSREPGLLCNGGNDYKLPHVGKLEIAAANSRDIPMRPPCRALIAGDHLNADAITAAIISSEQGTPTRLLFYRHLFDCCVSSAVAHRAPSSIAAVSHHDAIPPLPLPPPPCIDRVHRAAAHSPPSYPVAVRCPIA